MFYFSAPGNSKYIAELFCRNMDAECYSIEDKIDFAQLIAAQEVVGFCYPIFGSRVPKLMRKFVCAHMQLLKSKKVIIFCTQMGGSGDGARALTDILPRDFIDVIYAEHFLMLNNVCNLFFLPLPSEKTKQWYLQRSQRKMQTVCGNIKSGIVKKRGFNPGSQALGLIQGVFFPGLERMAMKRVWVNEDCDQCRLCETICPMGNFVFVNNQIETQGKCMMCCRCINKCPRKAISVFLRKKVRKQYTGI